MNQLTYKGKVVSAFTLRNSNGMEAVLTNFGGRLVSLQVPDRQGRLTDVVMGFDRLDDYFPERHLSDFGAVIGRYANRLAGGRITVDGVRYQLPQNNGPNCLHGGPDGWQYAVFEVLSVTDNSLHLALTSPDGDNGFPGEVRAEVTYTLGDDQSLRVDYSAVSDRPTVINMTNHSYFNLGGTDRPLATIHNHSLQIDADSYLPVDETMVPFGRFDSVAGTPMDLRNMCRVGVGLDSDFPQIVQARGYDHCWVLNTQGDISRCAAKVTCPDSGIAMELFTTEPGVQVYTGNFLDGVQGKRGVAYNRQTAICLETQQFPDSPNRDWPQSTGCLTPEKPYKSTTIFKFTIQ